MSEPDLNLLRVFDILYEERSVSRTAIRLNLTQSAVSHALKRLRLMLEDRLFVRVPTGLQPTARAVGIAPRIHQALVDMAGALSTPGFEPATSARRFNICAGSYFCTLLIPRLIALARNLAPAVSFRIWTVGPDLLDGMDEGRFDLAFTAPGSLPARIRSTALIDEEMVWIAGAGNPLAKGPADMTAILAAPRVTIHTDSDLGIAPLLDPSLYPAERVATVYDAATALAIVRRSDMVALVPRRLAEAKADGGALSIIAAAEPSARVQLSMLWHAKLDAEPSLSWLRDLATKALD